MKHGEEKLWEAIYYNIGELYAESASENLDNIEKQEYPEPLDDWFYNHLKELEWEEKKEKRAKNLRRIIKKVSIILMTTTIGFSSLMVGSEAFRIEFMKMFTTVKEKYTEITFDEIDALSSELLKDMSHYYYPEYIPEGYVLEKASGNEAVRSFLFKNGLGEKISFVQAASDVKAQVDTEDAVVRNVVVSGMEGIYAVEDGWKNLIWYDSERMFHLSGASITEDELFKMAESLKYIQ